MKRFSYAIALYTGSITAMLLHSIQEALQLCCCTVYMERYSYAIALYTWSVTAMLLHCIHEAVQLCYCTVYITRYSYTITLYTGLIFGKIILFISHAFLKRCETVKMTQLGKYIADLDPRS
jgi:hypothetical protein